MADFKFWVFAQYRRRINLIFLENESVEKHSNVYTIFSMLNDLRVRIPFLVNNAVAATSYYLVDEPQLLPCGTNRAVLSLFLFGRHNANHPSAAARSWRALGAARFPVPFTQRCHNRNQFTF
jgi:hypothetical protein